MTISQWPLALVLCLILSVGWSVLLFGVCRLVENIFPAAGDRHVLWWASLLAAAAPLAALAAPALAGAGTAAAGPSPFLGEVLGAAGAMRAGPAADAAGLVPVLLGALGAAAPLLLVIYGAGSAWRLAANLYSRRRLNRLLAACRPLEPAQVHALVSIWAAQLGVRRTPPALVTSEPCSPFSAPWRRRPVLVLSENLLRSCPPGQLALMCAHELAHVARRDLLFMRLQSVLCALFWFNPVVAAIAARLDATREAACDDRVLRIAGDIRRDYARAFLVALRHSAGKSACGIPFIHPRRKDHEMRLTHILNGRPGRSRKVRLAIAGVILAAVALPVAGGQAALAEALAGKAPEFSGAVISASMARMTSPYGTRVLKGERKFHNGVDLGAPVGTPVKSPGKGRVLIVSEDNPAYGKRIEIDYGGGWRILFGRLNRFDVAGGDEVKTGQQIGTVGSSGSNSTGPHLHLEVTRDGKHVDPATVLSLPGPDKSKGTAGN